MKKIFTILAATLFSASMMADEATLVLNTKATSTPEDFFVVAKTSGDPSYNANYTGVYNGISFTKGLKMESATYVSFEAPATATVTIVQSTTKNGDKTIKFDGEEINNADGATDVPGTENCRVYTLSNVAAGEHTINRGNAETGLLYIAVEWEGANPTCAAPTITISEEWNDENNGYLVTLKNNEEGATLTYSINDGDFQVYEAPFYAPSKAKVVAKASKEGYNDKTASASAPLHILIRELEKDTLVLVAGDTVSEKMEVIAPQITLILNDAAWQGGSKADNDGDVPEDFGYTAFVAGSNNPSVKDNIPTTGCFYTFVPSIDGTLEIGAKINSGKIIYVSENGTLLAFKVNGTEAEIGKAISTTENVYGKVVFDVKKDVNYYFWGSGTKVPFFGFKFKKGSPTAVNNIEAGEKAIKTIENGQLVIIKNGVRYNAQGTVVK